jgi:SAM-dependent methyltransferase
MPLDEYRAANRANWDDRVPIHLKSKTVYKDAEFRSNPEMISPVVEFDRRALGDVTGKSLLHLQCHIGHDTLSWARLGAVVTGVDFSEKAVAAAREISRESGTPGRFVLAELYDSPEVLPERFDIVYTGTGALCWLPDIAGWARVAAKFVRPGGTLYVRDGHPVFNSLDLERADGRLEITLPYFEGSPQRWDEEATYVEVDEKVEHSVQYEWNHGLGETVTALIEAGFRIDALKEYQFLEWQAMPSMVQGDDGWWRLPEGQDRVPLMYSIRATRDG